LLAQFNAIAAENGGIDDDAIATTPAAPAAPAKAPAPLSAAVETPEEQKTREAEKANPQGPKPGDWAAFRAQQREGKAKLDKIEQSIVAREQAIAAREKATEATSPERIKAHLESGNFDAIAQAFGMKSWNEMNDHAARAFATPEFKRMRELEARAERIEAERAEEKRQYEEQQSEARRQQAEREYVTYVDTSLKGASDAHIKALSEDPNFTQAVFGFMSNHFRQTGEELDVEDAARQMLPNIRAHYDRLHKIFGVQATVQQPEAARAANPDRAGSNKPARQTNKVARTRAAEPASGELSHADFIRMGKEQLEAALAEDIRNGNGGSFLG
jgi:hypothetical protein